MDRPAGGAQRGGGAVTGIDGWPRRGGAGVVPEGRDRWGVRGGEQEGGGLDAR